MSAQPVTAVRLRGLDKCFGDRNLLRSIDLDIAAGEFVALLGASGSGKTTLLKLLAGLESFDHGELVTPPVKAVVFQEPRLMPWMRVQANIALGIRGLDVARRARQALDEVGLAARADAWPATLSGGEAQRVALARALVRQPGLLLLDEPFSALDALTRIRMHRLTLALWRAHRCAVLLVTHDIDEALQLADRVVVLADGAIAADIAITHARPRHPGDPALLRAKQRVLGLLHLEGDEPADHDTPSPHATVRLASVA